MTSFGGRASDAGAEAVSAIFVVSGELCYFEVLDIRDVFCERDVDSDDGGEGQSLVGSNSAEPRALAFIHSTECTGLQCSVNETLIATF